MVSTDTIQLHMKCPYKHFVVFPNKTDFNARRDQTFTRVLFNCQAASQIIKRTNIHHAPIISFSYPFLALGEILHILHRNELGSHLDLSTQSSGPLLETGTVNSKTRMFPRLKEYTGDMELFLPSTTLTLETEQIYTSVVKGKIENGNLGGLSMKQTYRLNSLTRSHKRL